MIDRRDASHEAVTNEVQRLIREGVRLVSTDNVIDGSCTLAKALFHNYRDQAFSFTDCTSFPVMRERRLREVVTTDDRFRIMGFPLLPAGS